MDERRRKKEGASLWRRDIASSLSPFFLSPLRERDIHDREIAYSGTERSSTFIYVRPIDSLLYGARGKRRPRWTPDAEESEAAAGAAGVESRERRWTRDRKSERYEAGMSWREGGWKRRACA